MEKQRLSAAAEEWRRLRAVELHQAGWTGRAIATALGVGPSAVSMWLRRAREGGLAALHTRRHHIRKRTKLNAEQQQHLLALLSAGAQAHGFVSERWTGERVAILIKREFEISYHPEYIPRLLRSLEGKAQLPVSQASQLNKD